MGANNTWRDIGKPEWIHNRTDPPQASIIAGCNYFQKVLIAMKYVRLYGFKFKDVQGQMKQQRRINEVD